MKITKRQNNFENLPSSKILPGGFHVVAVVAYME
jgi:hypothetical protein